MLKAVFFEFRGVIENDRSMQSDLFQSVLLGQNLRLEPGEYEDLSREVDDRTSLKMLLENRGRVVDVATLNQLLLQKAQEYLRRSSAQRENHHRSPSLDQRSLLSDLQAFLFQARSRGLKIVLVTSTARLEVEAVLNAQQISPYFDCILCGEDLLADPVKPAGYEQAIATLKSQNPEESFGIHNILAIEATYRDLDAARSMGLSVVALPRHRVLHFLKHRSDWVVDRLTDLDLDWINSSLTPGTLPR